MPSISGPRWCRSSTKKCIPDSHLPFVYVIILSTSPIWRIGETNPSTKTFKILFWIVMLTLICWRPWLHRARPQKSKLSWILRQIFQDGGHRTCTRTLRRKHIATSASFWQRKHVQYFLFKFAQFFYVEIMLISGNDLLFPHGSEFEIPASPGVLTHPRPMMTVRDNVPCIMEANGTSPYLYWGAFSCT